MKSKMKEFTAIYDTSILKGIEYAFNAESITDAIEFCNHKFLAKEIIIRDEETKEQFILNKNENSLLLSKAAKP